MKLTTRLVEFTNMVLLTLSKKMAPYTRFGFLDARQGELGGVQAIDFEAIMRVYLMDRKDFFFVQVGAHEGLSGDPLHELVVEQGLRGVLVEPQPAIFARLRANYAQHAQLKFEQAAIAPADGTVKFYSVDPEFWHKHDLLENAESEISALDPEQIRFHVALFGGKALAAREAEYLRSEEVPAITLHSLLTKHDVQKYDLLQIDAEGFDYEILKMIEWESAPPFIQWETVHLSIEDRVAAWNLLRANGYKLYAPNSYNTLAVKQQAS